MAFPLLPIIGGAALGSLTSGLIGPAMGPTQRSIEYVRNRNQPNLLPDPQSAIVAWNKGFLTLTQFRDIMRAGGIDIHANNDAWLNIINAQRPFIGMGAIQSLYWRKAFSEDTGVNQNDYDNLSKHAGWGYAANRNWLNQLPYGWSLEQIRIMYALGLLTDEQFRGFCGSVGMVRDDDFAKFSSLYLPPSTGQINDIFNRGIISEAGQDEWLKLAGFTDLRVRTAIKQLGYKIPSPSELIDMAVKEVWDDATVREFQYDAEFDNIPEFKWWMEKQGYGGSPATILGGSNQPTTWAQAFWRKHWRNVSPEQVFRMLHRLRPDGGANGGPRVPGVTPVTMETVTRLLKVNDYTPFWRDKLAALSYGTLRLVDIRRMVEESIKSPDFKERVIGDGWTIKDWAKENFKDRGQTETDANALAELAIVQGTQAIERRTKAELRVVRERESRVAQAEYDVGAIDRADCITKLNSAGVKPEESARIVACLDREFNVKCMKSHLSVLRKKYMKGALTLAEVTTKLRRLGMTEAGARKHVACWGILMNELNAAQVTQEIQEQVCQGILSEEEAIRRLTNLGWSNAEALIEVASVQCLLSDDLNFPGIR